MRLVLDTNVVISAFIDPNDDMVLACAIAAQANAIVTGDNDLLVLKQHHRIQILRPRQALQKLKFSAGFP